MSDVNGDEERGDDQIILISPRDPNVVTPPTELQGPPLQSRFIFNPNQPWPPVLATRFFPPPPWPENLEGENLTIEPVVGPFLALTEEQMETPPGFGRFAPGIEFEGFRGRIHYGDWRRGERGERREERREDRREDRREELGERREERREDGIEAIGDDRRGRRGRRGRRDRDMELGGGERGAE